MAGEVVGYAGEVYAARKYTWRAGYGEKAGEYPATRGMTTSPLGMQAISSELGDISPTSCLPDGYALEGQSHERIYQLWNVCFRSGSDTDH
jgi:hypothetical protein